MQDGPLLNSDPSGTPASTGPRGPRVLLVDDDPRVRDALASALRAIARADVRCLPTAESAAEAAVAHAADVVTMDLDMPGPDPFDAVAEIVARRPACGVVVVSGKAAPELVDRAVLAGAIGYVLKEEPPVVIVGAVLAAAKGDVTFSKGLMDPAQLPPTQVPPAPPRGFGPPHPPESRAP